MNLPPWLLTISGWAYSALVLMCLLTALVRKRDPAAALGWSLAIVFLPGLGVIAFLLIGNRRINRSLARKIEHRENFGERTAAEDLGEHQHVAAEPADPRWSGITAMLETLGQPACREGNEVELYTAPTAAFEAMLGAIRAAEHHVHVEFYIFRDDRLGQEFVEALAERAAAGVEVRLLVDGLGSFWHRRYARRLRGVGGEVRAFLPLFGGLQLVSPNLRNHRKLVLCDGQVAFFGGLNVGVEYLGRRRNRGRPWADLHMCVRGPAVADLQRMFVVDWDFASGVTLTDPVYFPPLPVRGPVPMQILAGGPDQDPNPIRQALLAVIPRARRRIVVATPYLVPDPGLGGVLRLAAYLGVEVIILTQYPPPDQWLAFFASMFHAAEFDGAGCAVYGYAAGFLHAKAVVVDSEWAMLGSANLDNRSMFLNFELMAVFHEGDEPGRIEASIDELLRDATRLDAEWHAGRPWWQRHVTHASRLLSPLL